MAFSRLDQTRSRHFSPLDLSYNSSFTSHPSFPFVLVLPDFDGVRSKRGLKGEDGTFDGSNVNGGRDGFVYKGDPFVRVLAMHAALCSAGRPWS